jgi:hypothetical protein
MTDGIAVVSIDEYCYSKATLFKCVDEIRDRFDCFLEFVTLGMEIHCRREHDSTVFIIYLKTVVSFQLAT